MFTFDEGDAHTHTHTNELTGGGDTDNQSISLCTEGGRGEGNKRVGCVRDS